ncbi:MAG: DUF1684 domain-containing protein [Bacteroidota bacterium]
MSAFTHTIPLFLASFGISFLAHQGKAQPEAQMPKDSLLVQSKRKEKDDFFKSKLSPLSKKDKRKFKGLSYFDYQDSYRVRASLEKFPGSEFIIIQKTQNRSKYRKYGVLKFVLEGKVFQLLALQKVTFGSLGQKINKLFVPFWDASNGRHTYSGGRYLEVPLIEKPLFIDFNQAYNPYCVYNPAYICPIPPLQNRLEIAILAGEKNYKTKN